LLGLSAVICGFNFLLWSRNVTVLARCFAFLPSLSLTGLFAATSFVDGGCRISLPFAPSHICERLVKQQCERMRPQMAQITPLARQFKKWDKS
jgi:hypothetical protein